MLRLRSRAAMSIADVVRSDEQGQTLIEMAIVLPVFFMLLFGIFIYSMAFFGDGNAICAANVAARYASLHSSTALVPGTLAAVQSCATPYLSSAPASSVSVNPASTGTNAYPAGSTVGATVVVQVSVTYPTGIPFFGGGHITMTAVAERTISR